MRTANYMRIILKLANYEKNGNYKDLEEGFRKESIKFCENQIENKLEAAAKHGHNFCTIQLGFGTIYAKHANKVYRLVEDGYLCDGMVRSRSITGEPMDLTIIHNYLISHGYEVEINEMMYKMHNWGTLRGINLTIKFPNVDFPVEYEEEE